jgi:hypothetical protein
MLAKIVKPATASSDTFNIRDNSSSRDSRNTMDVKKQQDCHNHSAGMSATIL